MSEAEDGITDTFDEPNIELTIETLTGTTFEMRVFSTDTVSEIKNKIQRVEGIPVHHQNLLFQMKELQDFGVLSDLGITSGSTLKLVLSMRGGPISTRRFTPCDHQMLWRDLKELIEQSRDEILNEGATNTKVSVLLFKDGDALNVVRVIENEDGSYSPYNERSLRSPAPPSPPPALPSPFTPATMSPEEAAPIHYGMKPCHKGRIELARQDIHNRSVRKINENIDMAHKVRTLQQRMHRARNIRQVKEQQARMANMANRPPGAGDDFEMGELALKDKHRTRLHRPMQMPMHMQMPPGYIRNLHVFDPDQHELMVPINDEHDDDCVYHPRNRLRLTRFGLYYPEEEYAMEEAAQQEFACSAAYHRIGMYPRRTSMDYDDFGMGMGLGADPYQNGGEIEPDDIFYRMPGIPGIPRFTTAAAAAHASNCDMYMEGGQYGDQMTSRSPLYGRRSRNSNENYLPPFAHSPTPEYYQDNGCNIERLQNDYVDYEDLEQDVFGYYNNEFDRYMMTGMPPASNLVNGSSGLDISANYYNSAMDDQIEEEEESEPADLASELKKLTLRSDFQRQVQKLADAPDMPCEVDNDDASESSGAIKRELPAVVTKKRMRCGQCNKRLNVTNIYNCRCGRMFCSQHRYSESHDCKYDYKSEGRKLIEQQNPLVTASKLTKF